MPSREQLAIRRDAAYDRLNRGLRRLATRLDIEPADVGSRQKDKTLAAVIDIEQMADAVDAANDRLTELLASEGGVDLAALRERYVAEFAEALHAGAAPIEAALIEIDVDAVYGAIYDAYAADARRGGDDDRQAFMDALQAASTLEPIDGETAGPDEPDAADPEKEPDPDADTPPAADPSADASAAGDAPPAAPDPEPETAPAAQKRPARRRTARKDR